MCSCCYIALSLLTWRGSEILGVGEPSAKLTGSNLALTLGLQAAPTVGHKSPTRTSARTKTSDWVEGEKALICDRYNN